MKALLLIFFLQAHAEPFKTTVLEVYDKVSTLMDVRHKERRPDLEQREYNMMFPTDKPRGDETKDWADNVMMVFFREGGQVYQIALESYGCKLEPTEEAQKEVRERFENFLKAFTKKLFDVEMTVDNRYFKELGPDFKKAVRIPIREEFEPLKSRRISRGWYKCDGRSGFGYRYDFFFYPPAVVKSE